MTAPRWPRNPSQRFERWDAEQLAWRQKHRANKGHRLVVTGHRMKYLYLSLGGREELEGLEGLTTIEGICRRVQAFQEVVWDADVREILKAAGEGGLDETSLALGLSPEWIRKAARTVQPLDQSSEAMPWIKDATAPCPPNPLVRSIELHALWNITAGARAIAENLRDALLHEVEEEGQSAASMGRALGWPASRVTKRLAQLEDIRFHQSVRASSGQVKGVVPLRRRA